jgi:hypothetical protein
MTTSGRLATTIGIERHSNGTGRQNWPHDRDQNEPMQTRRERISLNPALCHGRACVRGTRVLVSAILDKVSAASRAKRYCGTTQTKNLKKRIFEHNNNRMLSIKPNAEHAAVELWHSVAPWFRG